MPDRSALIEFGPFRLDAARRVLWREGEVVPVSPKALDVLGCLVQQPGQVVTKDELMRRVWPDTFVEEANLTVHISTLRKALGRQPGGSPYIKTLPRRGYRYVGPPPGPAVAGPRSLAILPFTPLDSGSAADHLGIGMADALITRLGRLGQVLVRPTSAVLPYAERSPGPQQAGRELSVDAVLDGKVQRAGDRVRVTAQLVSVAEGGTLWGETLDERFTDLFRVQDALADRLASALALKLGAPQRAALFHHPTEDPEADRAYLKGRYFWNKLTGPWLTKALMAFREAVDRDPGFARAWSGLADTHVMLGLFGLTPPAQAWPRAREAATRAVELEPTLAEARVSLGYVKLFEDWDWSGAEKELRQAVELSPVSAEAHQWYALFLGLSGRFGEALAGIERAQELDPLSLTVDTNAGFQLYLRQQYQPEVEQHRRTLELDPDYAPAHWALGLAYAQQGRHEEAMAAHRRAVELSGGSLLLKAVLGRSYALAGRRTEAEAVLEELIRAGDQGGVSPYQLAGIHVALGHHDQAFEVLREAAQARDHWMVCLKVDPAFEPLRGDRRFEELVRRVCRSQAHIRAP